jgi:hypothetical protein
MDYIHTLNSRSLYDKLTAGYGDSETRDSM